MSSREDKEDVLDRWSEKNYGGERDSRIMEQLFFSQPLSHFFTQNSRFEIGPNGKESMVPEKKERERERENGGDAD